MGTTPYFDTMLPVPKPEQRGRGKKAQRQLEVFTAENSLWLRLGPVGDRDEGDDRYTVRLSRVQTVKLIKALEDGFRYLGDFGA